MPIVALELKTISGIPLHPLIVHIPVMLVPLAFLGAIVALFRPSWRHWLLPLTAGFTAVALAGVQLAIQSGEGLQEIVGEESALIERHSQLAEQARPIVLLFFLVATAAAVARWLVTRDAGGAEGADPATTSPSSARTATLRKLVVPLCALSVLLGGLSTAWVYRTGHTGAESVWKGEGGGKEGGASDKEDGGRGADDKPATTRPDGDTDGD